jgi:hypothetical protein
MNKKHIIIFLIVLIIISAIGLIIVYGYDHRSRPFSDISKINSAQIQKITVQNANKNGIIINVTDKQKIKEIYDLLNSLSYKKDSNQKKRVGWSYRIKIFNNSNLVKADYIFASKQFNINNSSAYYTASKDITTQLDNLFDWNASIKQ